MLGSNTGLDMIGLSHKIQSRTIGLGYLDDCPKTRDSKESLIDRFKQKPKFAPHSILQVSTKC